MSFVENIHTILIGDFFASLGVKFGLGSPTCMKYDEELGTSILEKIQKFLKRSET